MKRKLILIAFISFITTQAYSQIDKQFSMYAETKLQLNPAAAGFFRAQYKFFGNYRRQWWGLSENPIETYSASFDTRLYGDQRAGRFVGAGIVFANDGGGHSQYNQVNVAIPLSYAMRLNKFNYLSVGVAPGYFQRSIGNNDDLTWSNQWDNRDGFDPTIPSGEVILNNQLLVGRFDLAAGLYWEFSYDDYIYMSLGISGNHMTKPKVNFLGTDWRMNRTMNIHYFGNFGALDFPLTFKPSVMWSVQKPNKSLIFGTTMDILLRGESKTTGYYDRTSLELGAHFRMDDALVASMMFHNGGFSMGVSYDFVVSSLQDINSIHGASELFIYYRMGKPQGRGKLELADED
ncbi:MAG: PorP/SprF family type IX secretion system membrane protein [Crocinitomicaceae bacterium]